MHLRKGGRQAGQRFLDKLRVVGCGARLPSQHWRRAGKAHREARRLDHQWAPTSNLRCGRTNAVLDEARKWVPRHPPMQWFPLVLDLLARDLVGEQVDERIAGHRLGANLLVEVEGIEGWKARRHGKHRKAPSFVSVRVGPLLSPTYKS